MLPYKDISVFLTTPLRVDSKIKASSSKDLNF